MSMGNNVNLKDRLIRSTAGKGNNASKTNVTSKGNAVKTETPAPYRTRKTATEGTKKATFYVKKDLLQKLYNFAYWERHSVTDAFNIALAAGLKGKTTKSRSK